MIEKICYWCGNPATSKEHVPPKCLFPEDKDTKKKLNKSFKKNLITVPACSDHNQQKSNDDEYLMTHLVGIVGNNVTAFIHNKTKVLRAITRKPSLLDVVDERALYISDNKYSILMVNVDNNRLVHSFEAIARGLYFHTYNTCFRGKVMLVSKIFINNESSGMSEFILKSVALIESELPNWKTEEKGDNPQIFKYRLSPKDDYGAQTIAMTFYENIQIYALLGEINEKTELLTKIYNISDKLYCYNKFTGNKIEIKKYFE